jgi:hypothetical protein
MKSLIFFGLVLGLGAVGRAEEPTVRLRDDGVVERFDWDGRMHFKATGSRFLPVPKHRLPIAAQRLTRTGQSAKAGTVWQPRLAPVRAVQPRSAAPEAGKPKETDVRVRVPSRFDA